MRPIIVIARKWNFSYVPENTARGKGINSAQPSFLVGSAHPTAPRPLNFRMITKLSGIFSKQARCDRAGLHVVFAAYALST